MAKRKENMQTVFEATLATYKEKEKALEAVKTEYAKAQNAFKLIEKKLESDKKRIQEQMDELWKELEVHSKNFIQMVFWNANTGYPGLKEILEKITIRDWKTYPETYLYYQAFNPKSTKPGEYFNDYSNPSEILKDDPRHGKLEKAIYGKGGIAIDISRHSNANAKDVIEALLPVVFFFLVYKKKNCKEAVRAARDFFQIYPRWRYPDAVYDLL